MVTGPPETCCVRRAPTCPISRIPEQRTGGAPDRLCATLQIADCATIWGRSTTQSVLWHHSRGVLTERSEEERAALLRANRFAGEARDLLTPVTYQGLRVVA
jgi:hypothetical protein